MLSLFLTEAGLSLKLSDQLLKIEKALRHDDTCRPTGQDMRDSPADLASLFRVSS